MQDDRQPLPAPTGVGYQQYCSGAAGPQGAAASSHDIKQTTPDSLDPEDTDTVVYVFNTTDGMAFAEPPYVHSQLRPKIPVAVFEVIREPDGPIKACHKLAEILLGSEADKIEAIQHAYFYVAEYYKATRRPWSAAYIYEQLYYALLEWQKKYNIRYHKGYPLVRLSEVYELLGYPWHSERYLMLTLIEDAITDKGVCRRDGGLYWRFWPARIHDAKQLDDLYGQAASHSSLYKKWNWAPEPVLLELPTIWRISQPAVSESVHYRPNLSLSSAMYDNLNAGGLSDGKSLEVLAHYLISCIPGATTSRRKKTTATDYDVYCSLDGPLNDFREELGRHWLCECKDFAKTLGYSEVAKFSRTVDSAHCKVGILISMSGISGESERLYSERANAKLFQQHGIAILVLDKSDLEDAVQGRSLITILRDRYEKVRHDFMSDS